MDVFEIQLNTALEQTLANGHDGDTESRSSTPSGSMLASSPPRATAAKSRRARPETRDSEMSQLTRLTSLTSATGVSGLTGTTMRHSIGGARRPGTAIGSMTSVDRDSGRMFERSDYIAHRIASIQAKVSLDPASAYLELDQNTDVSLN